MHPQRRLILTLIPLVMALPLAMDVYTPALPDMAHYFAVNPAAMQLTLTLFMLAASIMQLFIGPLSDQTGRKFTLFFSIAAFGVGTLLCAFANSLAGLVIYRMIQAAGCCGMMGLAFAVVRDRHTGTENAAIYAYLSGVIAFSPMFAPFIRSFVDIYFAWRATFIALMIVVLWSLVSVAVFLPEMLPASRRHLFHWQIFKDYWQVFQHPRFYWYTLFSAMGITYFYLFCAMSPYVIITLLHIPEAHYGYYFAFLSLTGSVVITKHIDSTLPLSLTAIIFSLISFFIAWHWRSKLK